MNRLEGPTSGRSPRLLVLDDREGLIRAAPAMQDLRQRCEVTFLDEPLLETAQDLSDVQLLMLIRERTPLDAAALDRLPALEAVFQTGGHAYHVDQGELSRRGVPLSLTRHATAVQRAMPELTFLLAAACLRRLPEADDVLSQEVWQVPMGRTLAGRTLGILGMGRHGRNVARLGQALGMDVIAWRRTPGDDGDGIPRMPLDDLLARADVVSIHLRLSEESRGLIGARELALMRPRSVLVNTSRGAIVDEPALARALVSGPLGAAGLDVFTEEPLPGSSPLRQLPNAVLTPHIGWQVEEVFEEFAELVARQVTDYLGGGLRRSQLSDPDVALAESAQGRLLDDLA